MISNFGIDMSKLDLPLREVNTQVDQQSQIKNTLMKCYNESTKDGQRVDISKILEEYQTKFNVPKVLIMKWLGINQQKSLFNQPQFQDNLSQSIISQDSEYTVSECSPSIRKNNKCNFVVSTLGEAAEKVKAKGTDPKKPLSESSSLKLSKFSPERRCSVLTSLKVNLEVFKMDHKEKSFEESSERTNSSKMIKKLEEVEEHEEEDKLLEEPTLKKSGSKNIIRPNFIIRKKNMPSVRISKLSETSPKIDNAGDDQGNQIQTERTLKPKKSLKILKSSKKELQRPLSRGSGNGAIQEKESFQNRKSSLPNLKKWDPSKIAQSYFKTSLNNMAQMEKTNECSAKKERRRRTKFWTSKHTSSKSKLFGEKIASVKESSRNEERSYLNNNNHLMTVSGRDFVARKSHKTISIKDFLANNKDPNVHVENELSLFPDLNSKDSQKAPKFDNFRTFSINTAFSPPPMSKKATLVLNPSILKTERKSIRSKNIIPGHSQEKFGANLMTPQSYSTSNLKTFVGSSKLKPALTKGDLREISEHQSLSSSREVSLEQIDEHNKEIPKKYINLRKSFKERKNSSSKIHRKKSTFKIRKNKSSGRGRPAIY